VLSVAKGKACTDAWPVVPAALGVEGEEQGRYLEEMALTADPGPCKDWQCSGMGAVRCSCPGVSWAGAAEAMHCIGGL